MKLFSLRTILRHGGFRNITCPNNAPSALHTTLGCRLLRAMQEGNARGAGEHTRTFNLAEPGLMSIPSCDAESRALVLNDASTALNDAFAACNQRHPQTCSRSHVEHSSNRARLALVGQPKKRRWEWLNPLYIWIHTSRAHSTLRAWYKGGGGFLYDFSARKNPARGIFRTQQWDCDPQNRDNTTTQPKIIPEISESSNTKSGTAILSVSPLRTRNRSMVCTLKRLCGTNIWRKV